MLLAAYGGLRLVELVGLRVTRVDLPHGRISVAEQVAEVNGAWPISRPWSQNTCRAAATMASRLRWALRRSRPAGGERSLGGLGSSRGGVPEYGGRPPHYGGRRNRSERSVGRLKQFRRVATRYDKRACNYLAMVKLAAALVWL